MEAKHKRVKVKVKRSLAEGLIVAIAILGSSPCGVCQAQGTPITDGLVAYWPGEGNAEDASGNGHHGALHGDTTFATGVIGQAFSFDGDYDYVLVPDDDALNFGTSNFTLSGWFKTSNDDDHPMIIDKRSDSYNGYVVHLIAKWWFESPCKLRVCFVDGAGPNRQVFESVGTYIDGEWHHFSAVRDGNTGYLYMDGVFDTSSEDIGHNIDSSGRGLYIGSYYGLTHGRFDGLIDEIQIHNRALTAAEIAEYVDSCPPPPPPDPVDLLVELTLAVFEMNLQNGISNSLDTKLDAALDALFDTIENNDVAAVNALGAFINAVEAQRGNKLTDEQADILIADAQYIIDRLTAG